MTELDPGDLLLFARIVEYGSLSQASERLQLPKSTVSRRLTQLEGRLGERLLTRTTRKLVLTEFGASLLEHARRVAEETEAAGALAQHRQQAPSGLLRVSMPSDFANVHLARILPDFMAKYPAITLELDLSPRKVDLVAENFDLAIRMGILPDDATLVARKVLMSTWGLCMACPSIPTTCTSTNCLACGAWRMAWCIGRSRAARPPGSGTCQCA